MFASWFTKGKHEGSPGKVRKLKSEKGVHLKASTAINQVKTSNAEARECEEVREVVKNLEHALARYSGIYQSYILKNLPVGEFERVEQR